MAQCIVSASRENTHTNHSGQSDPLDMGGEVGKLTVSETRTISKAQQEEVSRSNVPWENERQDERILGTLPNGLMNTKQHDPTQGWRAATIVTRGATLWPSNEKPKPRRAALPRLRDHAPCSSGQASPSLAQEDQAEEEVPAWVLAPPGDTPGGTAAVAGVTFSFAVHLCGWLAACDGWGPPPPAPAGPA